MHSNTILVSENNWYGVPKFSLGAVKGRDKMRRSILMIVCAVAVGSFFCESVYAADRTHDGFFLRLAPGIGAFTSSEEVPGGKAELSGTTGHFNFGIGGAISENLILHFDASGISSTDPTIEINGRSATAVGTFSTTLIGIGLTKYFSSNIYLTGAVGFAKSSFVANGVSYDTDNGYGINLMIGKEWWVSENWGLGVAGQLLYTSCPDSSGYSGTKYDLNTTSLGLLFSATFN
jgi:hypothetical protein